MNKNIPKISENKKFKIKPKSDVIFELSSFIAGINLIKADKDVFMLKVGNRYAALSDSEAKTIIKSLIHTDDQLKISASTLTEVLERLRDHESMQISLDEETKSSVDFIKVKNGIYSIKKNKLIDESNSKLVFSYELNFNYVENADLSKAINFMTLVNTSIGKDNLKLFLEILGYLASSYTKARKAFWFIGAGKDGKSTLCNEIEEAIGEEYCSNVSFHKIGNEQSIIKFVGKKLNISRENSGSRPMRDDEAFKSLVCNEKVEGRRLYENSKEFVPKLKFLFAGNHFPVFTHMDSAILDRILPVYFLDRQKNGIPTDLDLADKLKAERDIVWSVALSHIQPLAKRGFEFSVPEATASIMTHKYKELLTVKEFFDENYVLDPMGKISSVAIFNHYNEWCAANALIPEGKTTFYTHLKELSVSIIYTKVSINGEKVNGFKGLSKKRDDIESCDDNHSKIPNCITNENA